jgi:hypothetical protein
LAADCCLLLNRVGKDRIVEAVCVGASDQTTDNIARMKKQAVAEAAEAALPGQGLAAAPCSDRDQPAAGASLRIRAPRI